MSEEYIPEDDERIDNDAPASSDGAESDISSGEERDDDALYTDYSYAENTGDTDEEAEIEAVKFSGTRPYTSPEDVVRHHLRGMYQTWFLEYASYVILERAVPNIADGLKPVQRRILHSMKEKDDGHFNKVANLVGHTMQYHPHGDASIKDALVQLGQKELLVETQGNWGNTLTGAPAAAGRYIEARLSSFALEVLYNKKVTEWTKSYDGRNDEPVTLPAKFPLLLVQGTEGIAVGLSSKILPHNFNEIIDAAVSYIRGEEFELLPDFPTGGLIDVSRYNDGRRGGSLKVRAKIEKIDQRTLAITEIPFGKTTGTVIDSILKAVEKNKIKIRKVEDHTSKTARIIVHLLPGTSSDKAIDALYAFTDCEVSISPNCCVIKDKKPLFLGVSDVLRFNVDATREILRRELEIQLGEHRESLLYATLERIFIEERIYKDKEYEKAPDLDSAIAHIDKRFEPYKPSFIREITRDDLLRLLEIRMKRILRFNSDEADKNIAALGAKIADILGRLEDMDRVTIEWFEGLRAKYGEAYPRLTQIRGFDQIEAATVAEANEKLYINRKEGFIGTSLKKDEFVCNCSSIDDIIIFYKDGRYKVVKVADKLFVDKNVLYVNVFKRNDSRTIYNAIYQCGRGGIYYMKRFAVTSVTRDTEYNLTTGEPGSRVVWFSANPNGEAEVVKVTLKPKNRLKTLQFDVDFAKQAIKGRSARGNLVTKNEVHTFTLKERGASTLGGREVWFDHDVMRLNYDGRGEYLGEFQGRDRVLVITRNGEYYTTGFEATNHYDEDIMRIEKFRPKTEWTAILNDADQGFPYIKRFLFEDSPRRQRFVGKDDKSTLILLSDTPGARFELTFGGHDSVREPMIIDAEDFISLKGFEAKGKRLTNREFGSIKEIEPRETPEGVPGEEDDNDIPVVTDIIPDEDIATLDPAEDRSDEEVRDEILGQKRIF